MCIRDRPKYVSSAEGNTRTLTISSRPLLIPNNKNPWIVADVPVSYTHLDVYKRQQLKSRIDREALGMTQEAADAWQAQAERCLLYTSRCV